MNAQDRYFKAIHRGLKLGGYHAMWPPGNPVTLGAIGRMVDGVFDPRAHLQEFVSVDEDDDDPAPDGLTYADEKGVDVTVHAGGGGAIAQAVADVDLSVTIKFHAANQVVLRAVGVKYVRVRNARTFAASIITAHRQHGNEVQVGDVFVNGLIVAESGAAAVSGQKNATLELTGRGDVAAGGAAGLSSLKAGVSIATTTKTSLEVRMTEGFVVAVRLVSLDERGVFKKRLDVGDVAKADGGAPDPAHAYDITFDEVPPATPN